MLWERFTFKGQKRTVSFKTSLQVSKVSCWIILNALFLVMVSFDGFMNYIVELIDNMSSKTADHLRANPLVIAHGIGAMKIITAISIAKDSHVSMISRALFAPHKGIQDLDSIQWILDFMYWIPIVSRSPESLSCIPDSKAQDSGFHSKNLLDFGFQKQNFARFWNSLHGVKLCFNKNWKECSSLNLWNPRYPAHVFY